MNKSVDKEKNNPAENLPLQARGFWYEQRNGSIFLCLRGRIHGQKVIHKFELPVGVRELKSLVIPV